MTDLVHLDDDDAVVDPFAGEPEIPDVLRAPLSFLCGAGGTGKTYLARSWVKQYPGTVLAATTGIAAVNLGEGTTINALLKYYDTASLEDSHVSGHLTAILGKLYRSGVRRILLDEVSMLDARQLTCLVRSLEELAGRGYARDIMLSDRTRAEMGGEGLDPDVHLPIALTLLGDFAQLPPVKADYAFESPVWESFADQTHTLTHIHRQVDPDFITALMAARRGEPDPVCDYFGPRLIPAANGNFPGSTILGTNDAVDRYNALRLDGLRTTARTYTAVRWGQQRPDWKNVPDSFVLKEGALVMLLANQRERPDIDGNPGRIIYANGDLGTVVDLQEDVVGVQLQRNGRVVHVTRLTRENTIPLEPGRKKELVGNHEEHLLTKDGRNELVGTVTYFPIRIAYATTCHKSQGLTLDAVQVNTREGMFKTPGLLYVALSRARTPDGLKVIGTVDGLRARVIVHAKVRPWL